MHRGDLDGAVAVYRELIARDARSAEAFYNLGLALKQKDDFAGAERELRRAIELDPSLPEAPYTLGVVLWQTGRAEEAESTIPRSDRSASMTFPTRTTCWGPSFASKARSRRRSKSFAGRLPIGRRRPKRT